MFDVLEVARQLKNAVLAEPERFDATEADAWVTGLPGPGEVQVRTGREPLWRNLGYWRDVERVDESNCERAGELFAAAQARLAHLLATTAGLREADAVLDCGFGYADQDILWAEDYRPARIVGLNATPHQVRVGRERMRLLGLEPVVSLELGSATRVPFGADAFDVVFALESAIHFRTREDFLREAARVLRPGGRLVVADLCQRTDRETGVGLRRRLRHRYWRGRYAFPEANVWTTQRYAAELGRAGFEAIRLTSIASDVFPAVNTALAALRGTRAAASPPESRSLAQVRSDVRHARGMEFEELHWLTRFNCDEYVIVSAVRS
ncbi:methyltransferase domain-containing protein [Myxococcus sp. K15C18031901]|uniref:class I SAM-dependent methyltransferase n=1 Tax=Myxococcus dinghuensis TaxID=2906761 RepID=UPI0020A712BB|nr:methyltransferase domain-containing protein [Myxococcus dinghuensis]MCP3098458.1 methyltransferase domain-containing protein [Myxococcus dinghuensis]